MMSEKIKGIHFDGAPVPDELIAILAQAAPLFPNGLPGTLTLDGKLASIKWDGERAVITPL